jgi:hypothetical protein
MKMAGCTGYFAVAANLHVPEEGFAQSNSGSDATNRFYILLQLDKLQLR